MTESVAPAPPAPRDGRARVLAWRRVRFALLSAIPFGLMLSLTSATTPALVWIARTMTVALMVLLAFGLCERWPATLPRWLARWGWQLVGVAVTVPLGALLAYWLTTGELRFWRNELRLVGFGFLCIQGELFAPWIAMGAIVRQREALARHQALAFQLERSEYERQALDARMRLLQAQVQPHFLFNTLANVRALVNAGSPRASAVLDSLIAYLRAAVPRLDEPATTIGQELELVRAYLELMHLRMPDRLQFTLHADAAALGLRCPPMALLTLVENAVRHGIDPGEEGGRIEVNVAVRDGRCSARVIDTGVGLGAAADRPAGTGLSTLRERLQLAFGGDARLSLAGIVPHGVCAEIDFPAQPAHAENPPGTR
ncbi:sensor histidine kinase [Ideonella sp.]|uniref:sensor histidine kinase n=1 Tax=Ideonella sp. TaxID=1929293 RepID=UPI002B4A08FB|nr:histidine kinase [Ideonella sp.]HJV69547.1 histidine kinase [Ideonella sp.]